jgi:hypothetical protein
MKNAIQSTGLLLFILLAASETNAQIQNVWVGGTPGRPIDWNIASNWSLQRVPDEFHDVVIPNTASTTFSYPVIFRDVEIHSLRIESGAKLVILETGNLKLNAPGSRMDDVLANNGEIENRSRNLIGFHESVFQANAGVAALKQ